MNREIKFRFWTGKEMLDWLCVCQTAFNQFNVVYEYNQIKKDQESKDELSQAFDSMLSHGDLIRSGLMYKLFTLFSVTAMQYTGLKDKNGKEIYEGDVLKDVFESGIQQIVIYDQDRFLVKGSGVRLSDYSTPSKIEVIGNIYENPELVS
jgi:uncharacterized phage protein (TIGR01671 family)